MPDEGGQSPRSAAAWQVRTKRGLSLRSRLGPEVMAQARVQAPSGAVFLVRIRRNARIVLSPLREAGLSQDPMSAGLDVLLANAEARGRPPLISVWLRGPDPRSSILVCGIRAVRHAERVTVDSWDDAEARFAEFAEDDDMRGRRCAINLGLLRGARSRWSAALECHFVIAFDMVFSPRGAPYSQWVRVQPRVPNIGDPTVAVSVLTCRPFEPGRPTAGSTLGGDICFVPTAPVVLESFLLQIGEPSS